MGVAGAARSSTMTQTGKLFLITGASSGFGRAFAEAALRAGHRVAGTVRREADRTAFEALHPTAAKAVILDVRHFDAVVPAVREVEQAWGPVDVLINNAGYAHEGVLEESPLDELIHQFEVNVFGAVAMIKAVLPGMREQRSGHIINITSMVGHAGMAGISYYCGSKFALEGISDSLAKEVKDLGIRVTAVAPGSFRTDWAGRSMIRTDRAIADYDAIFDPVRKRRQEYSGNQAGDPHKAAQAILHIVDAQEPPTHLLLGNDARRVMDRHLKALGRELDQWNALTQSTDFD